jgi:pimeloyl-ACP methyl ester carboxylesterase
LPASPLHTWPKSMSTYRFAFFFVSLTFLTLATEMNAEPQWMTLPPTPVLPNTDRSGYAPISGIKIWYAMFGRGEPVILLHGGLSNSNYWGNQVPVLAKYYQVTVMDSRGQGRSSRDGQPFSYELMAADVIGLMDYLKIQKAAIVGWSDGAIIGLVVAIRHPERLTKLFAFGANSDPSAVKDDVGESPVLKASVARREEEYQQLSPTPDQYQSVRDQIRKMQATQPNFTAEQLRAIKVPTWIVDGDHDEAIKRENTLFMADQIPAAGLLLQPGVSHFSFLQDPDQANNDILHFLRHVKAQP